METFIFSFIQNSINLYWGPFGGWFVQAKQVKVNKMLSILFTEIGP